MNASEKEIVRNPWRRTEERPRVETKDAVLGVLAIFVCALILGGAIPSEWTWLAMAALFGYVVATVRSTGSVLILLAMAFVAFLFTLSMAAATLVLALIVGTGSLAWAFTVLGKQRYVGVIAVVAAFGLSLLLKSEPAVAALAFCFLPAAVLMALATVYDVGRTNTVLYTMGGFLLSGAVALAVVLFQSYGQVSFTALTTLVEDIRKAAMDAMRGTGWLILDMIEQSAEEVKLTGEQLEAMRDAYNSVFSEASIEALVYSVVGIAPALIFIPTVIVAFGAHLFLLRRYYNTAWRKMMTARSCTVVMSVTASVLYFICFLLVILISKNSLFLTAVQNLFLILVPGLALVGANTIMFQVRRARGWGGVAWILLLIAMLCCSGFSFVYFLGMWGAYAVVSAALHKKLIQMMKNDKE